MPDPFTIEEFESGSGPTFPLEPWSNQPVSNGKPDPTHLKAQAFGQYWFIKTTKNNKTHFFKHIYLCVNNSFIGCVIYVIHDANTYNYRRNNKSSTGLRPWILPIRLKRRMPKATSMEFNLGRNPGQSTFISSHQQFEKEIEDSNGCKGKNSIIKFPIELELQGRKQSKHFAFASCPLVIVEK